MKKQKRLFCCCYGAVTPIGRRLVLDDVNHFSYVIYRSSNLVYLEASRVDVVGWNFHQLLELSDATLPLRVESVPSPLLPTPTFRNSASVNSASKLSGCKGAALSTDSIHTTSAELLRN